MGLHVPTLALKNHYFDLGLNYFIKINIKYAFKDLFYINIISRRCCILFIQRLTEIERKKYVNYVYISLHCFLTAECI